MARRPKFQKFQISARRRGVMEFDDAYNATDAARIAAKRARKGWTVEVQSSSGSYSFSSTRKRTHVYMTCEPRVKNGKTVASCTIKPSFKKQLQRRKR